MRRVELTHDVLAGVVLASRNLRQEREVREASQRQLAEQRQREATTHRALVRARTIAGVCAVLALISVPIPSLENSLTEQYRRNAVTFLNQHGRPKPAAR